MMRMRVSCLCVVMAVVAALSFAGAAQALLIENFDGGGTTAWNLTNSSGTAPSIVATGSSGNVVRLANLDASNNNSIAFDEEPTQTGPAPAGLMMAFSFRMTGDQANTDAGGCCDSAADGLGIGLYATGAYGASGGNNPGNGGAVWERPAHPNAFTVGLDIFQNIDEVVLSWGGAEVAVADVSGLMDLNNNVWHRAVLTATPSGANALVDMNIIEDVQGATITHNVFSGQVISGLDLANLPAYRVIAGGRTGGAFVAGDLDNIYLANIPEPSTVFLTLAGLIGLVACALRGRK